MIRASLNTDVRDHVMRTESSDSITSPPVTTLMPKVGRLGEVRVENELSRSRDRRDSWFPLMTS